MTNVTQKRAGRTEKLSVSIDKDISSWLRRAAAKQRTTVSAMIRAALLPDFERRHAK